MHPMRIALWIAGGAVSVAIAMSDLGAALGPHPDSRRPRDPAIEALVAETVGVPPEFAADILLRIAASTKTADPEWTRELLEQAFTRATVARELYRRTADSSIPPDTRSGALVQTYDARLDRVSLQARTALAMLPLDPARALELFEWIDRHLDRAACDDSLVPAADEYYNALTQIARYMSRGGAQARADAFQFFILHLWAARLPSEMPAVVKAIRGFAPARPEAIALDGALRSILEHAERDPRGFSTSGLDFVGKMSDLADAEHELGLSPSVLMQGVRRYLVHQLTGPRCADSVAERPIAEAFNGILQHPGVAARGLDPIAAKDMRPSTILPAAKIEWYWRTLEARRLHVDFLRLRGPLRPPLSETKKNTPEWRTEADGFLTDLERWTRAREVAEADDFYQKGVLFASVFDLVPQADLRARAMRGLVDLLRHSMVIHQRPALWFLPAMRLLESKRGTTRRELLDAFERSGHPVLVLYAHASRTVPPPSR